MDTPHVGRHVLSRVGSVGKGDRQLQRVRMNKLSNRERSEHSFG